MSEVFEALEEKIFKQAVEQTNFKSESQITIESLMEKMQSFVNYELYREDQEAMYTQLATKEECQKIKEEFDNLPKLDQCMLEIYNLQQQIDDIKDTIKTDLVYKTDLAKLDKTLKQHCAINYLSNDVYNKQIEPAVKQI